MTNNEKLDALYEATKRAPMTFNDHAQCQAIYQELRDWLNGGDNGKTAQGD